MSEFLAKFDGGQLVGLTAVVGGLMVGAIAILASQWRRIRMAEMEIGLKQLMVEKGMSSAEIEQILRATHDVPEELQKPIKMK